MKLLIEIFGTGPLLVALSLLACSGLHWGSRNANRSGCGQRSGCGFGAPVRGHLGDDQLRHFTNESLDFVHAPDHMANAFWVADPVVLKAFWCAGELDRPCHPIPPESSTISWPEEFDRPPKHLFMQPAWGRLAQDAPIKEGTHPESGDECPPTSDPNLWSNPSVMAQPLPENPPRGGP